MRNADKRLERQTLVRQLDAAAKILLKGVADLSDKDMLADVAPASTPGEAIERATAAVASTIILVRPQYVVAQRGFSGVDVRTDFRDSVRMLLNGLAEVEPDELERPLSKPWELATNWSTVSTAAEAIRNLSWYLAMLAGDISVARVALGRPEQDWQSRWGL